MKYLLVIAMTLVGAFGAYYFKKSSERAGDVLALLRVPELYLGGGLYAASAIMNVLLLRVMDYTVLYPMTAITYVWSLLISNRFLGERITGKKVAGIGLVCLGVVLLTR